MTYYDRNDASTTGERLWASAKKRPEAMLLFAAGCALLFSGNRKSLRRAASAGRDYYESAANASASWTSAASKGISDVGERVQSATQRAQDYLGDISGKAMEATSSIGDTAGEYADQVKRYASSARGSAGEQVTQVREFAQTNLEYFLKEQPIALGLIGLAAGAAIGAALPETEVENRAMGAQRDQLARLAQKAASDQIESLKATAGQVGANVVNSVKENGLSADGIRHALADVAGSFQDEKSGDGDKGRASGNKPGAGGNKTDTGASRT